MTNYKDHLLEMEKEKKVILHIWSAEWQDAINFKDPYIPEKGRIKFNPNRLMFACCCKRMRQCKNLNVQVYYDNVFYFCKDGKGCNAKNAKSWWCTKHQVNHGPKTRYYSC